MMSTQKGRENKVEE